LENFMKIVRSIGGFLLIGSVLMAGTNAAWAADPVGDGQQQARFLLGGRNFTAAPTAFRASAVDAQEQGRQMILGQPFVRASNAGVTATSGAGVTSNAAQTDAAQTKAAPGNRSAREGGDGMARRMILRSAS
jgi:hypothetical protein